MLSQDMILCSPAEQTRYKLTVSLIWWRVLQSHSQSMCFYYFYIISDSCHVNHSVMMWIYSTKGLQRDLKKSCCRSPRLKNQTEKAGEQTQHTAAANLQFTYCFFCPVFSKYKVHVHCCGTFFFSLCFTFVCFLVSFPNGWFSSYSWQTANPHTSGEQSILCCVFFDFVTISHISLSWISAFDHPAGLGMVRYRGTGSLSSWLTHLLISMTSQPPASSSALAALSPARHMLTPHCRVHYDS